MPMSDLSLLTALKTKMRWHQGRQVVLAENVANADTPNFQARDLKAPKFAELLGNIKGAQLAAVRTNAAHLGGSGKAGAAGFRAEKANDWEITPEGNSVSLEDQMMKVAENQMDYQVATSLYSRSLGLLRTAIGRRT